jgi:hypothetical protein
MVDTSNWDWDTGEKQIDMNGWADNVQWVEEPYVSPDGEAVAAIVNLDEGEFKVCSNGQLTEATFDKIWHLRYTADGRWAAIVSAMGEWTMAVDGTPWETNFGYVWSPLFSKDGLHIAAAVQQDMRYCMALDGTAWDAELC